MNLRTLVIWQTTDESLEEAKLQLQELIRAELSRLLEVETRRVRDAQQQKDALDQVKPGATTCLAWNIMHRQSRAHYCA